MQVTGEKLSLWTEYLAACHALHAYEICGGLTYNPARKALVCSHPYNEEAAASFKQSLAALDFAVDIREVPSQHWGNTVRDYTVTAFDPERLQPGKDLESGRRTEIIATLNNAAEKLRAATEMLSTIIPYDHFPEDVKEALREHRVRCRDTIKTIEKTLESGLPASLPLFEVLRLNTWYNTGSKDAMAYHCVELTDLKNIVEELIEGVRLMQSDIKLDAATAEKLVRFPSELRLKHFRLGAAAGFSYDYSLQLLPPDNPVSVAGSEVRAMLSDIYKELSPRELYRDIGGVGLSALYKKTQASMAQPLSLFPPELPGIVFKVMEASPKEGRRYSIAAIIPQEQAAAVQKEASRRTGQRFKNIPLHDGTLSCVLADDNDSAVRFGNVEEAASFLRTLDLPTQERIKAGTKQTKSVYVI